MNEEDQKHLLLCQEAKENITTALHLILSLEPFVSKETINDSCAPLLTDLGKYTLTLELLQNQTQEEKKNESE